MTMKRSSQSEHSKFSILLNELSRRFEVPDDLIEIGEKVEIISSNRKSMDIPVIRF